MAKFQDIGSFFKPISTLSEEEKRNLQSSTRSQTSTIQNRKRSGGKRGRGRPKKAAVTVTVIDLDTDDSTTTTAINTTITSSPPPPPASSLPPPPPLPIPPPVAPLIRHHYSAAQKQRMVEYARMHGIWPAARKFSVSHRNIHRWFKEEKAENFDSIKVSQARHTRKNKTGQGRKLSYPQDTDDKILEWIIIQRENYLPVSRQMICDKALSLVKPYQPDFKASKGWLRRFLIRHNLSLRARTSAAQRFGV